MMGHQKRIQRKLFYTKLNLDQRVPEDHILRKVARYIDFDFVYQDVKDKYGTNGNVSVPPPVLLKMMLLLIFYNVRSERELMATIPVRLDWLWFLGYDLDDEIPNHSVLSKARARWGLDVFRSLFESIVWQCVRAGLVDGSKIFTDASLVQADASNNSVVNQESLKRYLNESYREMEQRLEDSNNLSLHDPAKQGSANRKHISTTDPDASVVRMGPGRSKLRYKIHRAVDEKAEVITATEVTAGEVNEAHLLTPLIDQHQRCTGKTVQKAVADSKYGTIDNYLICADRKIAPHFESFDKGHQGSGRREGIFEPSQFVYNPDEDCFICPASERLKPRKFKEKRNHFEYFLPAKVCNKCALKPRCTRSKQGRTIKRHVRQDDLDQMLLRSQSHAAKRDIFKRQHLMERSFARSKRYGYKRARWRRLWRVQIQEYLTAAIQNMMVLIRNVKEQGKAALASSAQTRHQRPSFKNIFFTIEALVRASISFLTLKPC
ncbi:MAG: IS1182 family transposase [Candidatus Omnitrophica bacterium]|nr:IS1182 family transposase [Candidatus Omnitrophota bacterium]